MTVNDFENRIHDLENKSYEICGKLISRPIVILPAGRFHRLSIRTLDLWGISVDVLADSNPEKINSWEWKGHLYKAEKTDSVIRRLGNTANYIITSRPYREEIKNNLIDNGIERTHIFSMPVRMGDLVPQSHFVRALRIRKSLEEIEKSIDMLEDEESKEELWTLLSIFSCSTPVWIENFPTEEYFNTSYISLQNEGEVFVDAGMFDGKTTERFVELCPNYKEIVGIEANPVNIPKIRERLTGFRDIKIYNNALCNSALEMRFKCNGIGPEGARLSDDGEIKVQGVRGDDLHIEPTFIKFDIEGAEYDAILGFKETIKNYKPKMAISVYHSLEDHWRLIELIKSIVPDYQLYLRHHYGYEDLYGTILYAIMKES